MIRLALLLIAMALPARAETIVMGLSSEEIAITATFEGSEILVFGAVRREEPIPDSPPLEVIITVSGPPTPVNVRQKERTAGIWINRGAARVDAAPSFYAVATTGPLREILSETEDLRHSISIGRAIRSIGNEVPNAADYTDALIRIRREEGLYQSIEGGVDLEEETLFRTSFGLPANLVEGRYATRIFLTRGGTVIDSYETEIVVHKVGLERWLYNLAQTQPFVYGILSLVIAVAAGWAASAAAQTIRR